MGGDVSNINEMTVRQSVRGWWLTQASLGERGDSCPNFRCGFYLDDHGNSEKGRKGRIRAPVTPDKVPRDA